VICKRCLVSGRVQGVYYRGSAARVATSLGVTGHARNLADGRVEVLACGSAEAVEQFIGWLWEGPSAARVTAVDIEVAALPGGGPPAQFTTD
jgi:acylphosphatase